MRTVTIIAASEETDVELVRREVSASHLVLCADGGYNLCRRAGLIPHAVIGDLDSIDAQELALLEKLPVQVMRYPCDKNESDLELALLEAHRCGAGVVRILAALGGRLDHTLFNVISILIRAHELGIEATLVSSNTEARLFLGSESAREITIEDRQGWPCSLIPLTDRVGGIVLQGFRYPLNNEFLHQRETRGLSNVVIDARARILVRTGRLLSVFVRPEPS